ncbi:MAG: hypothetical protein WCF65_05220 [Parachlamydiaceae bacterium]
MDNTKKTKEMQLKMWPRRREAFGVPKRLRRSGSAQLVEVINPPTPIRLIHSSLGIWLIDEPDKSSATRAATSHAHSKRFAPSDFAFKFRPEYTSWF